MNTILTVLGDWAWEQTLSLWDAFTSMNATTLFGVTIVLASAGGLTARLAWCRGRTLRIIALAASSIMWILAAIAMTAWAWTLFPAKAAWIVPLVKNLILVV